jgi:hypothetical protein
MPPRFILHMFRSSKLPKGGLLANDGMLMRGGCGSIGARWFGMAAMVMALIVVSLTVVV